MNKKIGGDSQVPSKAMRILSIDEYLEYVGQLGRYQAIIMIVCSFLFFVPAHQSLLMVFVAHSPPWVCQSTQNHNATSACISSVFRYEGQPGFNSRCDFDRSEWKYTLPASHSIVSEVPQHLSISFLFPSIDLYSSYLFKPSSILNQNLGTRCFCRFTRSNIFFEYV